MTNRNFTNFNEFLNIRYFRRVDSIYMDLSDFDCMIERFKKISEENDKLKVENERFSEVINALAKAVNKQDEEIKQLKTSGKYMLDIQKNMLTESNERILENGKLKEEVKRLKGKSEMYQEMADSFCNNNIELKNDIEKLSKQYCNVESLYHKYYNLYKKSEV